MEEPKSIWQEEANKEVYTGKVISPEELEERKRKTDEDYNRIADNLNNRFKNPERYLNRKHSGKEKFGKNIMKRLKK